MFFINLPWGLNLWEYNNQDSVTKTTMLSKSLNIDVDKSNKAFKTILLFIIIYISKDTLMFGTNGNEFFSLITNIFTIFGSLILLVYSYTKRTEIHKKTIMYVILMCCLILLSMTFNTDFELGYIHKICFWILTLAVVRLYTLKEFVSSFYYIILFLAICSIIGFVLSMFGSSIINQGQVLTNTTGFTYRNFYFYVAQSANIDFLRNQGIFREPGVFQMYLILALTLAFVNAKSVNVNEFIILSLALILTKSTTGYITYIFLLLLLLSLGFVSTKHKIIVFLIIAFGGLYIFSSTEWLYSESGGYSVFNKILHNTASTVSRTASITENIKIFLEHPIFGAGMSNLVELFPEYTFRDYSMLLEDNTNTILVQFSTHGIFYGILWCYGFFYLSKSMFSKKLQQFLFLIIIILLFSGEDLTFSFLPTTLLLYGINNKNLNYMNVIVAN